MRYQGCMLVVKDAQSSKAFYQELFGCVAELDLGDYVVFREGIMLQQEETWLGFTKLTRESLTYRNHVVELYFEEAEFDAFVERLSSFPAAAPLSPVAEQEWGQRSIRFHDPDGHVLEVGEDMKAVVKRFLKAGMSVEEAAARSMYPVPFVETCREELERES